MENISKFYTGKNENEHLSTMTTQQIFVKYMKKLITSQTTFLIGKWNKEQFYICM